MKQAGKEKTSQPIILSRRIAAYITGISAFILAIASLVIYFVLFNVIESQDRTLIRIKASFIEPDIFEGNVEKLKNLLSTRYPQDLPKRLYVVIYDHSGLSIARTFNTDSKALSNIFPQDLPQEQLIPPGKIFEEKVKSLDNRTFSVSTHSYVDKHGFPWVAKVAVDHDLEVHLDKAVKISLLVMLFIAIVIVPLTSGLISKLIMKPLQSLSLQLSQTVPGKYYPVLDPNLYPYELSNLINTFRTISATAQQSFERLQSFSADISHELRNPIHSMQLNLELLLREPRTIDEYRDSLTSLNEDILRLSHLIESLLFLLRGERQLLSADLKTTKLKTFLNSLFEMYQPIIEDDGGFFSIDCPDHLEIVAEPRLLQQAIINLLENAMKYGRPSPPEQQIIKISVNYSEAKDKNIEITVEDNGPGVPDHELPYIFDRLYRSDRSRHASGYGLGLAIVRLITDLHGGSVSFRRLEDKRSAFTLKFPISSF